MNINGVVCYWEYQESKERRELWKLVESFPVDMDGYPLIKTSTGRDNDCDMLWLNTKIHPYHGSEDYEWEPIMGRAVTAWWLESGVQVRDLHPPAWVSWLSVSFIEELKKLPNWWQFLECGHDLYLGTARAAQEIIFAKPKMSSCICSGPPHTPECPGGWVD